MLPLTACAQSQDDSQNTSQTQPMPQPKRPHPAMGHPASGADAWDPLDEVDRMHQKMDQFFRDSWPQFRETWRTGKMPNRPALDIVDTDKAFIVMADLPGMNKDAIHIEVKDKLLTISGERLEAQEIEQQDYYRAERSFGAFQRTITLPEEVVVENVSAQYESGILEITLPKAAPEARKAVKVEIR